LWEALIVKLEKQGRVVKWVKVTSHAGIEGNMEADRLANQGRLSSLLYPDETADDSN